MTPKKPQNKAGFICIGKIIAAHGLRGGLLAKSFTEAPLDLASYGVLYLWDDRTLTPTGPKQNTKGVTFRAKESYTRDIAETLKGQWLYIPENALPKTKGREIYYKDLPGMEVDLNGEIFGTVTNVFDSGAHTILEIKTKSKEEILVPYLESIIPKIQKNKLIASEEICQFLGLQTETEK